MLEHRLRSRSARTTDQPHIQTRKITQKQTLYVSEVCEKHNSTYHKIRPWATVILVTTHSCSAPLTELRHIQSTKIQFATRPPDGLGPCNWAISYLPYESIYTERFSDVGRDANHIFGIYPKILIYFISKVFPSELCYQGIYHSVHTQLNDANRFCGTPPTYIQDTTYCAAIYAITVLPSRPTSFSR